MLAGALSLYYSVSIPSSGDMVFLGQPVGVIESIIQQKRQAVAVRFSHPATRGGTRGMATRGKTRM